MSSLPLIVQIQQSAIDGNASVAEALRMAKVACFKLSLGDFGRWVEHELTGYTNAENGELPPYRCLDGTPEAQNPVRGWQPIGFASQEIFDAVSRVPCGTSIPELESCLKDARASEGCFSFQYTIDQQNRMWQAMGHSWPLRVRVELQRMRSILDAVRNVLTDWTLKLEAEGVLGADLMFSADEKAKSAAATDQMATHIHINQVGAFVQNAHQSVVQGGVNSTLDLGRVSDLFRQIEDQRSNLPPETWAAIDPELQTLRAELAGAKNPGVIAEGLRLIRDLCVKAGSSVAATGISHFINAFLTNPPI